MTATLLERAGAAIDADIVKKAGQRPIHAITVQELAARQFKPRTPILKPFLHSQDLCMVFAPRGVGKTHLCLAMAYVIATGGQIATWEAPEPRKVLYLDGELPGVVLQKRLLQHCPDVEPAPEFFRVFTPDLLPEDELLPDLATDAGQAAIDAMIEPDTAVVFIDNLSAWARTGRENEAESWLPIGDWILRLRRRGVAVVLVHHAGKGGQQRGTSKKEDLLDVVIKLARPVDYDPTQGAVFTFEFTKFRGSAGGDEAQSLELTLSPDEADEDRLTWAYRTVEASTYDRVVALTVEGLTPGEIAVELRVNKSTVSRHQRHARGCGVLPKEGRK